jgi:protein lin-54
MRKQQQINCSSRLNKYKNEDDDLLPSKSKYFMSKSYAFINSEVAEATSQCLIAQAEESEHQEMNQEDIERLVIEEFGRCLVEIIESAESSALKITK